MRLLAAMLILLGMNSLTGCEPKQLREPVTVIADHCVQIPAGQPYTPEIDGYWISNEAFTRMLEKLNEQQHEINELKRRLGRLPQARGLDNGTDNELGMPVQRPEGREMYTPQGRATQRLQVGQGQRDKPKMDGAEVQGRLP